MTAVTRGVATANSRIPFAMFSSAPLLRVANASDLNAWHPARQTAGRPAVAEARVAGPGVVRHASSDALLASPPAPRLRPPGRAAFEPLACQASNHYTPLGCSGKQLQQGVLALSGDFGRDQVGKWAELDDVRKTLIAEEALTHLIRLAGQRESVHHRVRHCPGHADLIAGPEALLDHPRLGPEAVEIEEVPVGADRRVEGDQACCPALCRSPVAVDVTDGRGHHFEAGAVSARAHKPPVKERQRPLAPVGRGD